MCGGAHVEAEDDDNEEKVEDDVKLVQQIWR